MIVSSRFLKRKARGVFVMIGATYRSIGIVLMLSLLLGGCQVRVQYPAEFPSETVITEEKIYWFWGLTGEAEYEVYDLCPQGRVYEVRVYSTAEQSAYTALSLGIYSPRTLTIVCSIRGEDPVTSASSQ